MIKKFNYESFADFKNLTRDNWKKIERWMKEYNEVKNLVNMEEKIILIVGQQNSLKTSLAQFICKNFGMQERMVNIQDNKINKDIKELILQVSSNKNVLSMIHNMDENIGIIIDDFDSLLNNNDKVVITDFMSLFNRKKNDVKLMYPIIVVCQDVNDKKINDLKKMSCVVELSDLKEEDVKFYFDKICEKNCINITETQKNFILKKIDKDLTKYNHLLDDLLLITDEKIKDEDIELVIETFSNKSADARLSENLERLFGGKLTVEENVNMYYGDKFLFSFLVHENYPYNIGQRIKNEDKLEFLDYVSESLADNDVVQNMIFERQFWDLNMNSAMLTNVNVNFKHQEILERHKNLKLKFAKRKYATLLNKVSLYFTNRKVINQVLIKYGNKANDAFYLSEFICDILKKIERKDMEQEMDKYLIPLLKKLELTSEEVDLLLRLNKLDEVDIKKIYTAKYKNYVKQCLE